MAQKGSRGLLGLFYGLRHQYGDVTSNGRVKTMNLLDFFRSHRIKSIKKEIKAKEKLCKVQESLNELLREEQEIESN